MANQEVGIGGYIAQFSTNGKDAKFSFYDPQDVTNTADVSVAEKDFPEGITQPDARQVLDIAYGMCAKSLNDKRDARLKKEAADSFDKQQSEEARVRKISEDHLEKGEDVSVKPAQVNSDGTHVYNTEVANPDSKKK